MEFKESVMGENADSSALQQAIAIAAAIAWMDYLDADGSGTVDQEDRLLHNLREAVKPWRRQNG